MGPPHWTACNEVTRKLTFGASDKAVGWVMLAEIGPGREVWFGRIGSDFSFGPTTQARAKAAVEAKLSGQSFERHEGEKSWSGTCWKLLGGHVPPAPAMPEVGDPWLIAAFAA
jgi:hypothetical protein